ncbi:MAG: enoyl-CoA hydratase/isomerase family protein, partial [Balneolaceae bacterium]
NALNMNVLDELDEAIQNINGDPETMAIIITGAGDKAFVAGADIKELSSLDAASGKKLSKKGQDIFTKIENSGKPVIAAVNGYALGGGAELAMACHIRIGSKNAVFGLPETSLGLIPGYGGTQRLTALAGRAKALELILTARHVKADEALNLGILNEIAEEGSPVEAAKKTAGVMLKNGPVALEKAIKAVNAAAGGVDFESEASLFGELCGTHDFKEGTTAFLEKRKPEYKGR